MSKDPQLTSVKLLDDLYKTFKQKTIYGGITLQKLVNRTMHLYVTDVEFRERIESTFDLQISGSSY